MKEDEKKPLLQTEDSKDNDESRTISAFDFTLSKRWISGIPYEVAFWRSYYRNRSSRETLMSWSQYGKECKLDHFDVASFIESQEMENPVIVDVGCALSYMFSNRIGGKERSVIYLDPLAPYYNKILDDYSLSYPRIKFGLGETLSIHFKKNSLSLIHVRNALDHSVCPMMVIWQALICLRPGGVLYLNHKPNEAEHEAYIGFHQYNIDCQNGRFVIWNRQERIDVGHELAGYADVKGSVTDSGRIVAVITKTSNIPDDHKAVTENGVYASGMLETLITYFHSAPNVIGYQARRGAFSLGHRMMRLLPGGLIKKIKSIISGKKATM